MADFQVPKHIKLSRCGMYMSSSFGLVREKFEKWNKKNKKYDNFAHYIISNKRNFYKKS